MLSHDTIAAFVATADTHIVADVLTEHQLLGTDVGDRVLAISGNYPERHQALTDLLRSRGHLL